MDDIYTLPVALHADPDTLKRAAVEVGRDNGLDRDWEPESLSEAIFELCLANNALVSIAPHHAPAFPLRVRILIDDLEDLHLSLLDHGVAPSSGLNRCLLSALMLDASPADLGFEIHALIAPITAHDHLQEIHHAQAVFAGTPPRSC